jgi:hypothetical protein
MAGLGEMLLIKNPNEAAFKVESAIIPKNIKNRSGRGFSPVLQ